MPQSHSSLALKKGKALEADIPGFRRQWFYSTLGGYWFAG